MHFAASASETFEARLLITTPSSPSYTTLPEYEAGTRMVWPPARNEFGALSRYSGSGGAVRLSLAARAWKLFHSAIILVGTQGVSSVTSASGTVALVARGAENMSPS